MGAVAVIVLLSALASSPGAAQEAGPTPIPQPPPGEVLAQARSEWLAKAYVYIHKSHPDLSQPVVNLINEKYPQFWGVVTTQLDLLAAGKDPALQAQIRTETLAILKRVAPALHREVIDLINTRYPLLQQEIAEIIRQNPDTDPQPEIARLLRERYPMLLVDVRDEVLVRHPKVLSQIISAIALKWPVLFGDVVKQVHKGFPNLGRDVFAIAAKKYPELMAAASRILRGEPLEEEAEEEAPSEAPAPEAEKEKAPAPE